MLRIVWGGVKAKRKENMKIKEMIEVLQAFEDGKPIEFGNSIKPWNETNSPSWNFGDYNYRIKPMRNKRMIRPDELPFPCWVTPSAEEGVMNLIDGLSPHQIRFNHLWFHIEDIYSYQWSTDRKTWHSFEVEDSCSQ